MEPPFKKRILLILAVSAIQSNYLLATRFVEGGIEPKLPLDIFPLWTVWIIPYVLCYPLWAFSIVWLIWKMDERLFRATLAGLFFTCSLGVSIFVLFPTYVTDPAITGTDIFSRGLLFVQRMDGDHAAFPSPHIYVTVALALFYRDWYPKLKWIWFLLYLVISLSTLFTGQHYVLDVLGGTVLAWFGYRLGLWWNKVYESRIRLTSA